MTELRRRFIEDLQLQGKSKRTPDAYVRTVRMLAEHFNTSPDQLSEAQIRHYFLYVTNVKKWSASTIPQAVCGIKTFFTLTLERDWQIFDLIRPQKRPKTPRRLVPRQGTVAASGRSAAPLPDVSDDHLLVWVAPE